MYQATNRRPLLLLIPFLFVWLEVYFYNFTKHGSFIFNDGKNQRTFKLSGTDIILSGFGKCSFLSGSTFDANAIALNFNFTNGSIGELVDIIESAAEEIEQTIMSMNATAGDVNTMVLL